MTDSFKTRTALNANGQSLGPKVDVHDLPKLQPTHKLDRLPFSLKILQRFEDGVNVTPSKFDALLNHYQ